jgi:diguanylate cyclase (GGDEF)-like protein
MLLGVVIWIWIYKGTSNNSQNLSFSMGFVESLFFCTYSIAALGWNSGFFLSLIILFAFLMINGKIAKAPKIILGILITLIMACLFLISRYLKIDNYINPPYQNILFFLNLILGCVILAVITFTVESEKQFSDSEITINNRELYTLANTDPLTNSLNRRSMMAQLEKEKEQVDKGSKPFSLIMLDVDDFKLINDEYGHDCGDFVLVMLTEKIRLGLRKSDLIARWGGDEFLIMLAETDLANGEIVAEKLHSRVINSPCIYHEVDIPVTITLGISQCDRNTGIGSGIRKADLALYRGKQAGKNRVMWID